MKTWERRLQEAKGKHRPKLKNWGKDGFGSSRESDFLELHNFDIGTTSIKSPHECSKDIVEGNGTIYRLHCSDLSYDDFIRYFERPALPCVIADVPTVERWPAADRWTHWDYFRCFRNSYFKIGEDDDGYSVKTRMRYFLEYMQHNTDDSPLYVFDSRFEEDRDAKCLLGDFKVPSYFPEDLFELVGEKKRPPYRWFLVGPARSGTCVHIDPLGTSAWNTVLRGRKRWVLFPPTTPKSVAKGLDVIIKGEDDEAINYFVDILPRIKKKWGHVHTIVEFTQLPGDTVFVPGGWWHAVINLNDTVAITQNYCSSENFDRVWVRTRSGRKKMSEKFLRQLRESNPSLADRADALNNRDDFVMFSQRETFEFKKNGGKRKTDSDQANEEATARKKKKKKKT